MSNSKHNSQIDRCTLTTMPSLTHGRLNSQHDTTGLSWVKLCIQFELCQQPLSGINWQQHHTGSLQCANTTRIKRFVKGNTGTLFTCAQGAQRDIASAVGQRGPLHPAARHQQVAFCCSRRQASATCCNADTAPHCSMPAVAGFLQLERCSQALQLLFSGCQQSIDQVIAASSASQLFWGPPLCKVALVHARWVPTAAGRCALHS